MGLARERWCCARGCLSRHDMKTCQTSIKTGILLLCSGSPHLEYKRQTWEHHSASHRTEQWGGSQADEHLPPKYVSYDETMETIIGSYWSEKSTILSTFWSRICLAIKCDFCGPDPPLPCTRFNSRRSLIKVISLVFVRLFVSPLRPMGLNMRGYRNPTYCNVAILPVAT